MLQRMCTRRRSAVHAAVPLLMLLVVVGVSNPAAGQTIYVSTPQDIDDMRNNLSANYVQTADIDLSGQSIAPIGDNVTPFTGSFDGQGYEISNWTFSDFQSSYVGLFGASDGATFSDITLRQFDVAGVNHVGGLVGWATNSTIEGCRVVSGTEPSTVFAFLDAGGLAGRVEGSLVEHCSSEAHVECVNRWAGCLIGHVHLGSTVRHCGANGVAKGGDVVGGLTGNVHGSLMEYCRSRSTVIGSRVCGGLTGWIQEDLTPDPSPTIVRHCSTKNNVTSTGSGIVMFFDPMGNMILAVGSNGGIAGWVDSYSLVESCYTYGTVGIAPDSEVACGGLLGRVEPNSIVRDSVAYAEVLSGRTCGGLIAWATDDVLIENCAAYGDVNSVWQSGGLVGAAERCTIQHCQAYGDVFASGTANNGHADPGHLLAAVGGLVGYTFPSNTQQFHTKIHCSSAHGNVSSDGQMTGGLVGLLWGTRLTESYATGNVESTDNKVGGLIGEIFVPTVSNNFPDANEISEVINCHASGHVQQFASQPSNEGQVGGLVGSHEAIASKINRVENSYSVALVAGSGPTIGGLIGKKDSLAVVTSSYWDIETSGQNSSDGGVGKTSAEMMQQSTFVGWDFLNTWNILQGQSTPFLRCDLF